MAVKLFPKNLVYGTCEHKALVTDLEGRIRLKLRPDSFAKAYIKTNDQIGEYAILDMGDHWELGSLIAKNETL